MRERKEKTAYQNVGRGGATLIELCPLDPIAIIGLEFSTSTHLSLVARRNIYYADLLKNVVNAGYCCAFMFLTNNEDNPPKHTFNA